MYGQESFRTLSVRLSTPVKKKHPVGSHYQPGINLTYPGAKKIPALVAIHLLVGNEKDAEARFACQLFLIDAPLS